jgi:hypothetical protein
MTDAEREARDLVAANKTIALHDNFLSRRYHVKESVVRATRELIMLHGEHSPPLDHPGWMYTLDDIDSTIDA